MIIGRDLIASVCEAYRKHKKRIVFTNGCFDIIHSGHVNYLSEAKKLGDILIIGLNSDDSVRRLKGSARPLNTETDRAVVLDALKPTDMVIIFDEDTPLELIKLIKPDVLVKGGDYNPEAVSGAKAIVGSDFVREYGGKVCVIPLTQGKSTIAIISKMNDIKQ